MVVRGMLFAVDPGVSKRIRTGVDVNCRKKVEIYALNETLVNWDSGNQPLQKKLAITKKFMRVGLWTIIRVMDWGLLASEFKL
jgi:hypothetical protein